MKYGVTVTIVQTGYIEVEANCEEAKAKVVEDVLEEHILHHEREMKECKNEKYF